MMIGIDTFSWAKIIKFHNTSLINPIQNFIDELNIFVTVEGKREFEYRFPEYTYILDQIIILPLIKSESYSDYLTKYDENDASLLDYSILKSYRIISEDRPLLSEGFTNQRNIVQLVDFFVELYLSFSFFTKNETIKMIKKLRKWRNIKKKKAKYYRKLIQQS